MDEMSSAFDFKLAFQAYLRAHFQSYTHVAFHYGVRERTAFNWWEGTCAPSGEFVNRTWSEDPRRAARYLGAGEAPAATKTRQPGAAVRLGRLSRRSVPA